MSLDVGGKNKFPDIDDFLQIQSVSHWDSTSSDDFFVKMSEETTLIQRVFPSGQPHTAQCIVRVFTNTSDSED